MDYFFKTNIGKNENVSVHNYVCPNDLKGSVNMPKKPWSVYLWQTQGKAQMGEQREMAV